MRLPLVMSCAFVATSIAAAGAQIVEVPKFHRWRAASRAD
jgi:hypothetical protein